MHSYNNDYLPKRCIVYNYQAVKISSKYSKYIYSFDTDVTAHHKMQKHWQGVKTKFANSLERTLEFLNYGPFPLKKNFHEKIPIKSWKFSTHWNWKLKFSGLVVKCIKYGAQHLSFNRFYATGGSRPLWTLAAGGVKVAFFACSD
jgi:hypothetical protein